MSAQTEIERRFTLNLPQLQAYSAIGPGLTGFWGFGRGVGKSFLKRFAWWNAVLTYDGKIRRVTVNGVTFLRKGVKIGALMPTLKQFKDVHADDIENELSPDGPWGFLGGKYNRSSGVVTFPGGSIVRPFPAAEHNSKKGRGFRCDIADLDECDDIAADTYDSIVQPWLSAPWSLNIKLLSGTPTRGRHGLWYRTREMGRIGERLRAGATPEEVGLDAETADAYRKIFSFVATFRDAPETVSPEAAALAKATTPPSTFAREWESDPDAGEGLVYVFTEENVAEPPPGTIFSEILIGCDHGYEDPGVLLLIGVVGSGNDAVCYVLEEIYEQHRIESWWIERVALWAAQYPNHSFFGDPSQPSRLNAYKRVGARVKDVDNSISEGISAVADRLFFRTRTDDSRVARLYVSRRCPNTIRELGLYRNKRDRRTGAFIDEPDDRDNHAPDALRYAIFNRFGPASSARKFNRYDERT